MGILRSETDKPEGRCPICFGLKVGHSEAVEGQVVKVCTYVRFLRFCNYISCNVLEQQLSVVTCSANTSNRRQIWDMRHTIIILRPLVGILAFCKLRRVLVYINYVINYYAQHCIDLACFRQLH